MSENPQQHSVCPRCYGFDHDILNCPKSSEYIGCRHCGEKKHTGKCEYSTKSLCRLCKHFKYGKEKHCIKDCPYVSNPVVVAYVHHSQRPCPYCNTNSGLLEEIYCDNCKSSKYPRKFHSACLVEHMKECTGAPDSNNNNNSTGFTTEEENSAGEEEEQEPAAAAASNGKCWVASTKGEKLRLYTDSPLTKKKNKKAPRTPHLYPPCIQCDKTAIGGGFMLCKNCEGKVHIKCHKTHISGCPEPEDDETEEEEESNNNTTNGKSCVYCHDHRIRSGWSSCDVCHKPCHELCISKHKKKEHETKEKEETKASNNNNNNTVTAATAVVDEQEPLHDSLLWAKKEFDLQTKGCVAVKEGNVVVIGKYKKIKLLGQEAHSRSSFLAAVMRAGQSACYYMPPDKKNMEMFLWELRKIPVAYEDPDGNNVEGEDYPEGEELTKELTMATASYFSLRLIVIDETDNGKHHNSLDLKLNLPLVFVKKAKDGYYAMVVNVYMIKPNESLTEARRTLSGKSVPPTAEKTPASPIESKEEEEEEKKVVPMEIETKYEEKNNTLDLYKMLDDLELSSDRKARFREAVENAADRDQLSEALPRFPNFVVDLWTVAHGNRGLDWWEKNHTRIKTNMDQGFSAEAQAPRQASPAPVQPPLTNNNNNNNSHPSPVPINNHNNQQAQKRLSVASIDMPVLEPATTTNNNNNKKRASPTPSETSASPKRQQLSVKQSAAPNQSVIRYVPKTTGLMDTSHYEAPPSSNSSSSSSTHPSIFAMSQEDHKMDLEEPAHFSNNYDFSGLLSQPNDALAQYDSKSVLPVAQVEDHDPAMNNNNNNNNDNESLLEDVMNQSCLNLDFGEDFKTTKARMERTISDLIETNSLAGGTHDPEPVVSGMAIRSYSQFDTQSFYDPGPQQQFVNNSEQTVQKPLYDPFKQYAENNKSLHDDLEDAVKKGLTGVTQQRQLDGSLILLLPPFQIVVPKDWNKEKKDKYITVLIWIKMICEYLIHPLVRPYMYKVMINWFIAVQTSNHSLFEETLEYVYKEFPERNTRLYLFFKLAPTYFFECLIHEAKQ